MHSNRFFVALASALALSAMVLSGNVATANSDELPIPTYVRSYAQPCEDFAKTPGQMAHDSGSPASFWFQPVKPPCELSYDGPVSPIFPIEKDTLVRIPGTEGPCVEPEYLTYGQVYNHGPVITLMRWYDSQNGKFVTGKPPVVKWSRIKHYIRKESGHPHAGTFWHKKDPCHRKIKFYSGPRMKFFVPQGLVVVDRKTHTRYLSGYEVKLKHFKIMLAGYLPYR